MQSPLVVLPSLSLTRMVYYSEVSKDAVYIATKKPTPTPHLPRLQALHQNEAELQTVD